MWDENYTRPVDLNSPNGCDYFPDCFTCVLPKCIIEEPLHVQLKRIKKLQAMKVKYPKQWKVVSCNNPYAVEWDATPALRLAQHGQRKQVREYLSSVAKYPPREFTPPDIKSLLTLSTNLSNVW